MVDEQKSVFVAMYRKEPERANNLISLDSQGVLGRG
jgi:hypothetical protein